jgi:hypothetical protein
MYRTEELVELGQRVAEDGTHRHERALLEVAFLVQAQSPGAAAVLADRAAPQVLRERAFSVASDVLLRTVAQPFSTRSAGHDRRLHHVTRLGEESGNVAGTELQQLLLDWQGQLAGWGA